MKLYGVPMSPYFTRCWLLLHLKGQAKAVHYPGVPGNALGTPDHLAMTPIGRIPYAELEDGTILTESQVIADYLERVFPTPPLRPADPAAAAQVDLICRLLDLYILPEIVALARSGAAAADSAAEHLERAHTGIGYLEHFFASEDWAVGDQISLADCALLPFLFYTDMIQRATGIDLLDTAPKLAAYRVNVADQDLARLTFSRMQASVEAVRKARAGARSE
ncbi:MAG: glutathione S-transferase family protein [Rhodothalassiaceae bacterium]